MATAYKKLIIVPTPKGTFGISPSQGTIWKPHKETGLTCHQAKNKVDTNTSAGIYCLSDPNDGELNHYEGDLVELWVSGTIVPYNKGYRAEKAVVTSVLKWSFELRRPYGKGENPLEQYVNHFLEERTKITKADAMKLFLEGDLRPIVVAYANSPMSWDFATTELYKEKYGVDDKYIKSLVWDQDKSRYLEFVREHGSAFENFLELSATWIGGNAMRMMLLNELVPGTLECIAHDPQLSKLAMGG